MPPASAQLRAQLLGAACSLSLILLAGCATTPLPDSSPASETTNDVYHHMPERRIASWKKLNPIFWLGNEDDRRPPPSYRPGERLRVCRWYLRNPCHNFMFYVIGISDKEFSRVGTFPSKTMNPAGGWAWAVCRYKCLRLPCVSYKAKRFDFYFGWRNRGNFGIAMRWKRGDPDE